MTITVAAPVTLADVMAELRITNPGRAYPISLGDTDVRTLAGVPSGPISLSNLYGKSSYTPMTVTGINDTTTMAGNTTGVIYPGHAFPNVSVSGGSGGYTYLWSITGGSGFTLTSSTSQSCDVAHTITATGFNGTCTLSCAVTDNTSHTVTVTGVTAVYTA